MEKIQMQLDCMGHVDLVTGNAGDRRKLLVTEVYPLKGKSDGLIWGYVVNTRSIGSGKVGRLTVRERVYRQSPIKQGDIIHAQDVAKNQSGYWYLQEYRRIV
jgi:hypothetical protein